MASVQQRQALVETNDSHLEIFKQLENLPRPLCSDPEISSPVETNLKENYPLSDVSVTAELYETSDAKLAEEKPVISQEQKVHVQDKSSPEAHSTSFSGYPSIDLKQSKSIGVFNGLTSKEDRIKSILSLYSSPSQQKSETISINEVQPISIPSQILSTPSTALSSSPSSSSTQSFRPTTSSLVTLNESVSSPSNDSYSGKNQIPLVSSNVQFQQPPPYQQNFYYPNVRDASYPSVNDLGTEKPISMHSAETSIEIPVSYGVSHISYSPQKLTSQQQQQTQQDFLQLQLEKQLEIQKKQSEQSKDILEQVQTCFDRIKQFMENVDRRLSNLESVTQKILKNQTEVIRTDENSMLHLHPKELDAARRMQEQLDLDAETARKLQMEFNKQISSADTTRSMISSSTKKEKEKEKKIATPAKSLETNTSENTRKSNQTNEKCPICFLEVPSITLEEHVNACLDRSGESPKEKPEKSGVSGQSSNWLRIFGRSSLSDSSSTGNAAKPSESNGPPSIANGTKKTSSASTSIASPHPPLSSASLRDLNGQPPSNSLPSIVRNENISYPGSNSTTITNSNSSNNNPAIRANYLTTSSNNTSNSNSPLTFAPSYMSSSQYPLLPQYTVPYGQFPMLSQPIGSTPMLYYNPNPVAPSVSSTSQQKQ